MELILGFVLAAILLFIGASFIDEAIQSFKDESYFRNYKDKEKSDE